MDEQTKQAAEEVRSPLRPTLTNEVFALRNGESVRFFEGTPPAGADRVLAVMVRSVLMPGGERKPVDHRGRAVEQAAILACEQTPNGWAWVPLSAPTKELIGDLLFDVLRAEPNFWYFLAVGMADRMAEEVSAVANTAGAELIRAERLRQIQVEGFGPERDDRYTESELVRAAKAYLRYAENGDESDALAFYWPDEWSDDWFKPSKSAVRNLAKAGALVAAEIDRLLRAEAVEGKQEP